MNSDNQIKELNTNTLYENYLFPFSPLSNKESNVKEDNSFNNTRQESDSQNNTQLICDNEGSYQTDYDEVSRKQLSFSNYLFEEGQAKEKNEVNTKDQPVVSNIIKEKSQYDISKSNQIMAYSHPFNRENILLSSFETIPKQNNEKLKHNILEIGQSNQLQTESNGFNTKSQILISKPLEQSKQLKNINLEGNNPLINKMLKL